MLPTIMPTSRLEKVSGDRLELSIYTFSACREHPLHHPDIQRKERDSNSQRIYPPSFSKRCSMADCNPFRYARQFSTRVITSGFGAAVHVFLPAFLQSSRWDLNPQATRATESESVLYARFQHWRMKRDKGKARGYFSCTPADILAVHLPGLEPGRFTQKILNLPSLPFLHRWILCVLLHMICSVFHIC